MIAASMPPQAAGDAVWDAVWELIAAGLRLVAFLDWLIHALGWLGVAGAVLFTVGVAGILRHRLAGREPEPVWGADFLAVAEVLEVVPKVKTRALLAAVRAGFVRLTGSGIRGLRRDEP